MNNKLIEFINNERKSGKVLSSAIEIGPSFPINLIKLYHKYRFQKCVGIELKSKEEISKLSNIPNSTFNSLNELSKFDLGNLIYDKNPDIQFYNTYRAITALSLKEKPINFDDLENKLKIYFEQSFDNFEVKTLKKKPNEFGLFIASKVFSHIEEEQNELLFQKIKEIVRPEGIIFLRLNSEEYLPLNKTIKQVFTKEKCDIIKSNFTLLHESYSKKGKEYELILRNIPDGLSLQT